MSLPSKGQILAGIAKTRDLVPAPRTLARALELLQHPDSGLMEIAQLISSDTALAADMLHCANSAFHNRNTKVGRIDEALQVIGFRETIRMVSHVVAHQTTHRDLGCYGITAENFWAESLFNGLFLENLARRTVTGDPDEAYTAGLLRYVGRLAIDQVLQGFGARLAWDGTTPLATWERQHVGLTQAAVGARLLRIWELPPTLVKAIASQDDATPPDPAGGELLAQCLHFAAQLLPAGLTTAQILAPPAPPPEAALRHPFASTHGLDAGDLMEMLEGSRTGFQDLQNSLHR